MGKGMGKVQQCDLQIRGFRFLGGGGDDARHLDPADVVADRDGEIVYEPGMIKCFGGVEKGFKDIVKTNDGSFGCFPKTYIFKDFYPVIKDSRTGMSEDVVGDRQRNGYGVAMDRIAQMTSVDERVKEYAKVASVMAMADWKRETKAVSDAIYFEITSIDDSRKQRELIRLASQTVVENVHVNDISSPIFEKLLVAANKISNTNEKAIAESIILAKMNEEGCYMDDKKEVAVHALNLVADMKLKETYLAAVEVARNIGNAVFADLSIKLYDDIISRLEKLADPKFVVKVLNRFFPNLNATGLAGLDYAVLERAIHLIGEMGGTDLERAEAIRSAANNITPVTIDSSYQVHFDCLKEIAGKIKSDDLRESVMNDIGRRENYVYEV